jgi:penicillin-binding protein 2
MDARDAIKKSCDVYFYRISETVGIDAVAAEGKALGLGQVTGLSIAAEVPGVMPDSPYHDRVTPGGYTKGMALNTAIGQGDVNVTPLQLAVLYAAIGNGGNVFTPQVVQRVESAEGAVLETFGPKLVRQIKLSEDEHHLLIDSLSAVVNEPGGTGGRSRLKEVVVAGKTGTAQVVKLGTVREKKDQMEYLERDHAWFVAFAPAGDPQIAIVVLNEHGGHGGSDAAPAAKLVLEKFFELQRADGVAFGPGWQPPPKPPPAPIAPVAPELTVPKPAPAALATAADAGPAPIADVKAPAGSEVAP